MSPALPTWKPGNRLAYDTWITSFGAYLDLHVDEARFEGAANVPRSGPLLIVSNHLHVVDPLVAARAVPRRIHFMAKQELYRHPLVSWGLRSAGTFPVDRFGADFGAVRIAVKLLEGGDVVCMFPEGTRSRTPGLRPPHPGAGYLAVRSGAAVIALGISGTESLSLWRLPGSVPVRIRAVLGEPFFLQPPPAMGVREAAEWAGHEMMRRIAALLPPAYRGIYAAAAGQAAVTG